MRISDWSSDVCSPILRADQELLALTQSTLAAQQDSYKLTRQSYDLGVATELDLSQAEIALRTAQRNLSQYTRMAAQDRHALVLLVGQPLTAEDRKSTRLNSSY